MNGGNEATQLLRKMINCRTLGIPFSPQLHLPTTLDQPMALLKVCLCNFSLRHHLKLLSRFRMRRSRPADDENKLARADQVCKTRLAKRSADRLHSPPLLAKSRTHLETTCGPAPTMSRRATTTTTARRAPTTISRVRRRICRARTAEPQPQRSGAATCAARWFATLADCTSSCTASTGLIQCAVTRFTHADVVPRATNPTEEVSGARNSSGIFRN